MGATATMFAEWFAGSAAAQTAATTVAAAAAQKALTDKPEMPELETPQAMPDPLEQAKARERAIIEQLARRGRSASILTQPGSGPQALGS